MLGERQGEWDVFFFASHRKPDSQLFELLEELPGVCSYDADGVLAELQDAQHPQAVQPALTYLRQVVVLQLSGGLRQHTPWSGVI